VLNINGNYTQTSTGILDIDIGGPTPGSQYDQLLITGTAILDGTVNIFLVNGYTPGVGDAFTILTFASHTGVFAAIVGLNLGNGHVLIPSYSSNALTLTAQ
jgi:hypothetical protein